MSIELSSIKPFEICSIRPPTENYSLTFRLTRNCYWNKCTFCPAYKFSARFSKRSVEEIHKDIQNAKRINDLMDAYGIGNTFMASDVSRVEELINTIESEKSNDNTTNKPYANDASDHADSRLSWFFSWFKDKPTIEDSLNHVMAWRMGGTENCFLGDADSLILKPGYLKDVIKEIKRNFISIQRFTVYGRTRTAARTRSLIELEAFRSAGLNRVHFGLESGSDSVLKFTNKGVSRSEHIEGALKTKEAGLSCSVYVMPGLGGVRWSDEHAVETAGVLTTISPDFIRLRTLQIFPETPLETAMFSGEFTEADDEQVVREIRMLIENINTRTEILSDSASNLLNINGRLPDQKEGMLREIDKYLDLSERDKLIFSFQSRLDSFTGQYGGISRDIAKAIGPYLKNGQLNLAGMADMEIKNIIQLIRSKLMP